MRKALIALLGFCVPAAVADTKDTVWIIEAASIGSTSISDTSVKALAAWRDSYVSFVGAPFAEQCGERVEIDAREASLVVRALQNQERAAVEVMLIEHGNAPERGGCVLRGIRP